MVSHYQMRGVVWVWAVATTLTVLLYPCSQSSVLAYPSHSGQHWSGRDLLWWWGDEDEGAEQDEDEEAEQTTPSEDLLLSSTIPIDSSPVNVTYTTETPSRWRSWFSKVKDAAKKVRTKVREQGIRNPFGMGLAPVGEALVRAGNATKETVIRAGKKIKSGAKRVGSAIKSGFRKIRLKFTGTGEKFRIVSNRLKEKLEAGDDKAIALIQKLGIKINFMGNKITGSSVEDGALDVAQILENEGMLANKSSSYATHPETETDHEGTGGELEIGYEHEVTTDNEVLVTEEHTVDDKGTIETSSPIEDDDYTFHSAEEYLDPDNIVKNETEGNEHNYAEEGSDEHEDVNNWPEYFHSEEAKATTSDNTLAEPYEPPPFPDVFSDHKVRDRLRDFYDNGDFSHAELSEIFNFDAENYEYYYDYTY
ncbi:hypothetical protein Pmani_019310 [Petrolisthes manimaculis]|uniref:Uncharacterized protein n=1 Tax=Petrolisthes manimaculis TaxID=1843537 RepID=A0AAE1U5U4_9EUCA|nr:hypothetical protein Pmani_019310 [Petrolisthes manimaculis]